MAALHASMSCGEHSSCWCSFTIYCTISPCFFRRLRPVCGCWGMPYGRCVRWCRGYITNVAVRPECRRQGIAGKLLQVFLDFAQGNHLAFLTLEVRASNYDAIALYGSRGFRSVGRRKNYYEHPKEDAIIMTKEFAYGVETGDTGTAGDGV